MKKIKRIVGDILKINLDNGYHTYARVLNEASYAFYDCRTIENLDINVIISKPILFIIAVSDDVINKGLWEIVGHFPLEEKLQRNPKQYIFDAPANKYEIYDNGIVKPASKDECIGLERCSVWLPEMVINRINNYYKGIETERDKRLGPLRG